ncbi:MAG: hypothetical protein KAU14_04695 [Thermoplasmata archaeon]|nr:hypothetical protein [Thermoplasmata archaeon]
MKKEEQELTLPKWFKPDPTAGDKGRLLYLEEWGKGRRFRNQVIFIGSGLLFFTGIFFLALPITEPFSLEDILFSILVSAIFFSIGFIFLWMDVTIMPFSIYENGFTTTNVSWSQGKKRIEQFIPWSQVSRIELETEHRDAITSYRVIIHHAKETQYIPLSDDIDMFQLITLLMRVVQEKMDPKFRKLVGPELELLLGSEPDQTNDIDIIVNVWIIMVVIFMVSVSSMFIWDMINDKFDIAVIVILTIIIPAGMWFLFAVIHIDDRTKQLQLIRTKSRFTQNGIFYPVTRMGRWLKDVRNFISWDEVISTTLKLNYALLIHEVELELSNGEIIRVPSIIYRELGKLDRFKKENHTLYNRSTVKNAQPLSKWKYSRLVIMLILFWTPLLSQELAKFFMIATLLAFALSAIIAIIWASYKEKHH